MLENTQGFPKLKAFTEHDGLRVLVIDLFDQSLEKAWQNAKLIDVIIQITSKLQTLHECRIVHGDIKPANIICSPNFAEWFLIDFGLSHVMDRGQSKMYVGSIGGSWLYCGRNVHCGIQSFQNDFESLAFLIVRYFKQTLPWSSECIELQRLFGNASEIVQQRNRLIQAIFEKKTETIKNIAGIGLPKPFQSFIEACFTMDPSESPPYNNAMKNILC